MVTQKWFLKIQFSIRFQQSAFGCCLWHGDVYLLSPDCYRQLSWFCSDTSLMFLPVDTSTSYSTIINTGDSILVQYSLYVRMLHRMENWCVMKLDMVFRTFCMVFLLRSSSQFLALLDSNIVSGLVGIILRSIQDFLRITVYGLKHRLPIGDCTSTATKRKIYRLRTWHSGSFLI